MMPSAKSKAKGAGARDARESNQPLQATNLNTAAKDAASSTKALKMDAQQLSSVNVSTEFEKCPATSYEPKHVV